MYEIEDESQPTGYKLVTLPKYDENTLKTLSLFDNSSNKRPHRSPSVKSQHPINGANDSMDNKDNSVTVVKGRFGRDG